MTEALAQTVLQMGMTNYQPLHSCAFYTQQNMVGYKLHTFLLRTLYRIYTLAITQHTYDVAPF